MGHIKCVHCRVNVNVSASTSVPFRPTTVQVPNLTLNWHETDNSAGWNSKNIYQRQNSCLHEKNLFLVFIYNYHVLKDKEWFIPKLLQKLIFKRSSSSKLFIIFKYLSCTTIFWYFPLCCPTLLDWCSTGKGCCTFSQSRKLRYRGFFSNLQMPNSHEEKTAFKGSRKWETRGVRKEANVRLWSQTVAIEGFLPFEHAALD